MNDRKSTSPRNVLSRDRLERAIRLCKDTKMAGNMLSCSAQAFIRAAKREGLEIPWKGARG